MFIIFKCLSIIFSWYSKKIIKLFCQYWIVINTHQQHLNRSSAFYRNTFKLLHCCWI